MRDDVSQDLEGTFGARLSLSTKVAKLYYESQKNQPEIAALLNIPQSRVSRLLKAAASEGIVRTVVISPEGLYHDIETELAKRYNLLDAVVVESAGPDEASLVSALGAAGAFYLESTLASTDRVGISSWSSNLLATVNSMTVQNTRARATEVVQLIGGVGLPSAQVQANYIAGQLARLTGAEAFYFYAPGIVGSRLARDALMSDLLFQPVQKRWEELSTLLLGVGALEPSALLTSSGNAVEAAEAERLRDAGAVGDICYRFFNEAGELVPSDLEGRVLGISSHQIKNVSRRIGIAGGARKYAAIKGALVGGWVNILITDLVTARRLIEEEHEDLPGKSGNL